MDGLARSYKKGDLALTVIIELLRKTEKRRAMLIMRLRKMLIICCDFTFCIVNFRVNNYYVLTSNSGGIQRYLMVVM